MFILLVILSVSLSLIRHTLDILSDKLFLVRPIDHIPNRREALGSVLGAPLPSPQWHLFIYCDFLYMTTI